MCSAKWNMKSVVEHGDIVEAYVQGRGKQAGCWVNMIGSVSQRFKSVHLDS